MRAPEVGSEAKEHIPELFWGQVHELSHPMLFSATRISLSRKFEVLGEDTKSVAFLFLSRICLLVVDLELLPQRERLGVFSSESKDSSKEGRD